MFGKNQTTIPFNATSCNTSFETMVLDSLGDSLKRTLKKIANAAHVDSDLVKEVVRDIQRALLQADVNVKLVVQLSKTIEKRALEEKPPAGMSNREHVIRIVYDELVKILGESRELAIKKQVIMMVGLYGQGKCVHKDSLIPLTTGEILKAQKLYEQHRDLGEIPVEDGTIINVSEKNLFVPSFNPKTMKIEHKKVTTLWKLQGKELLKIGIDAGNDYHVKVTPEHPFFVLRGGQFLQVRADTLQPNDYIATPRSYHTKVQHQDLYHQLQQLPLDIYITPTQVKSILASTQKSKKEICEQLTNQKNYCRFINQSNQGRVPIELVPGTLVSERYVEVKVNTGRKTIRFPRNITPELAEFIGYFVGDGHLTKQYLEIVTADEEIIERVTYLATSLFNLTPVIKTDKRSKAKTLCIASKTLTLLFSELFHFPFGKKGTNLSIPQCVLQSSDESIASFLQAYVDSDGSICKSYRLIEISSESRILLKQISLLLQRFGIFSGLSRKKVNSKFYGKLCIEARNAERYAKEIGSKIHRKQKRLAAFHQMGLRQGCGKHDMIPTGELLQNLRCSLGHSISSVQSVINSYGIYERQQRISKENLEKLSGFYTTHTNGDTLSFLQLIKDNQLLNEEYTQGKINSLLWQFAQNNLISNTDDTVCLTGFGKQYLQTQSEYHTQQTLDFIANLAFADVCWIQVKSIEKQPYTEQVYDLTVEDNHSFIADGLIVHNTTSCGKLAHFFKRKGLRPALIAGDVHRPAAYQQLQQIAEQNKVPFYGDVKAKDAVKVIKEGMDKFKRSADVIIVDTSGRHKLEDDLIEEMKQIFKATKPDEKLLVMDAAMGQQAGPQAKAFNEAIGVTGIVLTKLDGTAKGGGALSAASEVGAPIVFVGTGEHSTDFEKFNPEGFISRLLGMGDIKSLLEKAQESMKGKDAEKTAKRLMSGKFNLNDMYDQMDMISGMGPLSKVAEMLPFGQNAKLKDVDIDDTQNKLQRFRIIMDSMTAEEREKPDLIKASRVRRIAHGAGVETKNVKELLKYYNMTKRMMKGFSSDRKMRKNLMRQLQFNK